MRQGGCRGLKNKKKEAAKGSRASFMPGGGGFEEAISKSPKSEGSLFLLRYSFCVCSLAILLLLGVRAHT